ncbi:MAG: hypothetical protein LKM43_02855 [Wolbachia endosymbiont of Penenirmus auritus]|nr:hypothetical protein [Wolbachia endosymbiont of Penenirmus auritus]
MVAKTEKKDEKTSLGSKILDYVPWRTALTIAAFTVPVIGPVAGAVVGALAYGNYRKNNRTKDEESSKENAKPGRLEKLLSQAGTIAKRIGVIATGFLFGGPIGGIIAMVLMVADGISGGKLIQGAEKALDAGYDVLSAAGKGILDAGRQAVDKMKGSEEKGELSAPEKGEGKPTEEKAASNAKEVNNEKLEPGNKQILGPATKRLAQGRESANQEQGAGVGK